MGDAEDKTGTALELSEAARLRQQIAELQAELDRIKKEARKS
jgi:uncharacterized small protein (DUF1192 family)